MKQGKRKKYLIGGKWMTIKEIARQPWCPVTDTTVRNRMLKGMSLVEACTTPQYEVNKCYLYKGKMRSITYLARLPECAVSYHTLWARLNYGDWPSVELAVTMPRMQPKHKATIEWRYEKLSLRPIQEIIRRTEG